MRRTFRLSSSKGRTLSASVTQPAMPVRPIIATMIHRKNDMQQDCPGGALKERLQWQALPSVRRAVLNVEVMNGKPVRGSESALAIKLYSFGTAPLTLESG
jgi:hypothetical protein